MVMCLAREIELRTDYLEGETVETIYFGGGTPSAMPVVDIQFLLKQMAKHFTIAEKPEITLEANPDDITPDNLKAWKDYGINRLSIGIQAFQEHLLREWNRSHSAQQAAEAIALSQSEGFENITADLIYGGAGLSDEDWESNIQKLLATGIPHISSYTLTVEKGTALDYQVEKGKVPAPDDEQANRQYASLQSALTHAGLIQYEVSNFAKPGFTSRHNMSYWKGVSYLGIGPSAHSYNKISRQWNVAHNIKYIEALREGRIPSETEVLTLTQQYNERVMTGLRTSEGIDLERIASLGILYLHYLEEQVHPYLQKGVIVRTGTDKLQLVAEHFFYADGIAADLFYIDT